MKHSILLVCGLFVVLLLIAYCIRPTPPSIDDVWVINLDKDTERLANFTRDAQALGKPINRFPAVYGKDVERDEAEEEGIHPSLTGPEHNKDRHQSSKIVRRAGEYGCWLSHKRLLRHLGSLPVSNSYGHFITEDDCVVSPDFMEKWTSVREEVPSNWDVVYIGIHKVHGERVAPHVYRYLHGRKGGGNWGLHGYLVRHGAIPSMLKEMEYYDSPVDVQYYRRLQHLNMYILDPPLVKQREGIPSNIVVVR
jgi:GR25 family glycosyltransferase involved in LPS biosynthesis